MTNRQVIKHYPDYDPKTGEENYGKKNGKKSS